LALASSFVLFTLYKIGRADGWEIGLTQYLYLHTQNILTQLVIPEVGFQSTIPVFERAKILHALDLSTSVIGSVWILLFIFHT
jgi:hypothetical protein